MQRQAIRLRGGEKHMTSGTVWLADSGQSRTVVLSARTTAERAVSA